MIRQYLEKHNNIGKLHNSYLVSTDNADQALEEIQSFIRNNLLNNVDLSSSSDYQLVSKLDSKTKNITVDQIRNLQTFFYKTSILSGKKASIIFNADEMNNNASNSCLKLLEEPPSGSHLFLITTNAANIIPTIRSRCAKINHLYHKTKNEASDDEFIKPLLKQSGLKCRLDFLQKFTSKDRDLWRNFIDNIEKALLRISRHLIGYDLTLSPHEQDLLKQFKNKTALYVQNKYEKIRKIAENTENYDLDLRCNALIILDDLGS